MLILSRQFTLVVCLFFTLCATSVGQETSNAEGSLETPTNSTTDESYPSTIQTVGASGVITKLARRFNRDVVIGEHQVKLEINCPTKPTYEVTCTINSTPSGGDYAFSGAITPPAGGWETGNYSVKALCRHQTTDTGTWGGYYDLTNTGNFTITSSGGGGGPGEGNN